MRFSEFCSKNSQARPVALQGGSFAFEVRSLLSGRPALLRARMANLGLLGALAACIGLTSPALASEHLWSKDPQVLDGGSSDILVVESRDARIVNNPYPGRTRILLQPKVYRTLEDGVLDGSLQYLSIDSERFFVAYSEDDNALYAYDCLGMRYLVAPSLRTPQRP